MIRQTGQKNPPTYQRVKKEFFFKMPDYIEEQARKKQQKQQPKPPISTIQRKPEPPPPINKPSLPPPRRSEPTPPPRMSKPTLMTKSELEQASKESLEKHRIGQEQAIQQHFNSSLPQPPNPDYQLSSPFYIAGEWDQLTAKQQQDSLFKYAWMDWTDNIDDALDNWFNLTATEQLQHIQKYIYLKSKTPLSPYDIERLNEAWKYHKIQYPLAYEELMQGLQVFFTEQLQEPEPPPKQAKQAESPLEPPPQKLTQSNPFGIWNAESIRRELSMLGTFPPLSHSQSEQLKEPEPPPRMSEPTAEPKPPESPPTPKPSEPPPEPPPHAEPSPTPKPLEPPPTPKSQLDSLLAELGIPAPTPSRRGRRKL